MGAILGGVGGVGGGGKGGIVRFNATKITPPPTSYIFLTLFSKR